MCGVLRKFLLLSLIGSKITQIRWLILRERVASGLRALVARLADVPAKFSGVPNATILYPGLAGAL